MATSAHILIESRMRDALAGDAGACFDLGIAHSCGMQGRDARGRGTWAGTRLVEAYKWFELAARGGYAGAAKYRAEVARDMSAREIAEARRRLRLLEASHARQVARFSASLFA